jgi:hypothetical protein
MTGFNRRIMQCLMAILLASSMVVAQTDDVRFSISDIRMVGTTALKISFKISRSYGTPIVVPKLDKQHLCSSLLRIDVTGSGKTYRIVPCNRVVQIDQLVLDSTNSVVLEAGQTYSESISLIRKEIPFLRRPGRYVFHAEFNLNDANMTTELGAICKKDLKSNEATFKLR